MCKDIKIENLNVHFQTNLGNVKAVHNVSMDFSAKKVTGIIGETGSGKSVLGLSILKLLPKNAIVLGKIIYQEKNLLKSDKKSMLALRGKEIGLVPQNPGNALNPTIKVGEQIIEGILFHNKVRRKDAINQAMHLLKTFMLPSKYIKSYPFELSGGMKQRILTSIGISCSPKWLIADEPTKGLDAIVRRQVYETFYKIKKNENTGIIMITHDLTLAKNLCDTIVVMYAGEVLEVGDSQQIFKNPKHPYTKGLLYSQPHKGLKPMKGSSPSLIHPPKGCKFHSRCKYAIEKCSIEHPSLFKIKGEEKVRCILFDPSREHN